MTTDEVEELTTDIPCRRVAESELVGISGHILQCPGKSTGANASFQFQGDTMIGKAEAGL